MENIYNVIRKFKRSRKIDFAQVETLNATSNKVIFEKQKLKDFSKVTSQRVSVSVWIGKKHGRATGNTFSEELLNKAVRVAKASENLEYFYGLPKPSKPKRIKGLYDSPKSEEDILKHSEALIVNLKKNESMPYGAFEYSVFKRNLVNSEGIDFSEKGTLFRAYAEYIISQKKQKQPVSYGDSYFSRKLPSKKKIEDFSKQTLNETRELKNPVKLKKIPEVVILEQGAFAELLDEAFLSNFNGLNVLKKRSILAEKEGSKLFSENFNLTDSGVLEGGIESKGFDGEGTPCRTTELVKKGVVKSFIYDYNTGKHMNKESTGNSTGSGIGFNNIIVGKGKGIDVDEALIVKGVVGAHTSNELTTEFSVKSMGTFFLKNRKKTAVKDVMIKGKMIELLNNIEGIGKEIKNIGNFYLPKIAFRKIIVSKL